MFGDPAGSNTKGGKCGFCLCLAGAIGNDSLEGQLQTVKREIGMQFCGIIVSSENEMRETAHP